MKKGYKECPYCKNEIKDDAIKCQYCKEFLETVENNEKEETVTEIKEIPVETKESPIKYSIRKKSKNRLWILLTLGILFIALFIYKQRNIKNNSSDYDFINDLVSDFDSNIDSDYNSNTNYNDNYSLEKVRNNRKNIKTYDELKEDLNKGKMNPQTEELFKELGEIIETFYGNIQSIQGELNLQTSDYKNETMVRQTINSRKLYADYFDWYSKEFDTFLNKHKDLDTGTGGYSFSDFSKEIKKLSDSVSKYKDKNVEFYNYILSIQDDFYVGTDGQVYFYNGGSKMDKYNQISKELYNSAISFIEDYNNYTDFINKYDEYLGTK